MSVYDDIPKESMYKRDCDIYQKHKNGISQQELSKKYGLSRSRISAIIKKEQRNSEPFYKAIQEACLKYKKETMATKIYNILCDNGLMYHINSGEINLNDFTDDDLKKFEGLGDFSVKIVRTAWDLFKKNSAPTLPIPEYELRGYLTGNDLISLIRKHNLGDKKIYYAGHNCIGFEMSTVCVDGCEQTTCGDLNVLNANFIEFGDYID